MLLAGTTRPVALSGAWAGGSTLLACDPVEVLADDADPFDALDRQPALSGQAPEGFVGGGWFGMLGYRLGRRLERRPPDRSRPHPLPDASLAFYDHVVRIDPTGAWWFEALWTEARADELRARRTWWEDRREAPQHDTAATLVVLGSTPGRAGHCAAVEVAQLAIGAGDLYQANICLRLDLEVTGSPIAVWERGVDALRPARGAYLGLSDRAAVVSWSPETFLVRSADRLHVNSQPIKGTRPRAHGGRAALEASEKDRAEHIMIVDLVRNDLAHGGAQVTVASLLEAQPMAGVWHLVSRVDGRIEPSVPTGDVVRAAFPPGSVTGAPKVAALALCDALEPTGREAYCGAIGFASPTAGLELSVAIRTVEVVGDAAWIGLGGGVVADSEPIAEWRECHAKAAPLLVAVGASWPSIDRADVPQAIYDTLLCLDGRLVRLGEHARRFALATGCGRNEIVDALSAAARDTTGTCRVRIDHEPGRSTLRTSVAEAMRSPCLDGDASSLARLDLVPFAMPGGLGDVKLAHRARLEGFEAQAGVDGAALLVDGDEVLETTRAALLAVIGGVLCVPPLDGRILPSVSRRVLLDIATDERIPIRIAPLRLDDLAAAEAVLLTSAIRLLHIARPTWSPWRTSPGPSAIVRALARGLAARTVPRVRSARGHG